MFLGTSYSSSVGNHNDSFTRSSFEEMKGWYSSPVSNNYSSSSKFILVSVVCQVSKMTFSSES